MAQPATAESREDDSKYLFYVLGGPGVGKSTIMKLVKEGASAAVSGAPEFNFLLNKISMLSFEPVTLDTLREKVPVAANSRHHPHPEKHGGGLGFYRQARQSDFCAAFRKAANIYLDDHGDLPAQDEQFLRRAREAGYKIALVNVTISPEDYMKRQRELGKKHGYDPAQRLEWAIGLFKTAERAFKRLTPFADSAFILERTGAETFVAHDMGKRSRPDRNKLARKTSWRNVTVRGIKKMERRNAL